MWVNAEPFKERERQGELGHQQEEIFGDHLHADGQFREARELLTDRVDTLSDHEFVGETRSAGQHVIRADLVWVGEVNQDDPLFDGRALRVA